jgi:tetratricopeptide (TPR) repeat protein
MTRKQLRSKPGTPSKDSAASLHAAGMRHFQSGNYGVAEERVRRALTLEPQHADSLHLAGLLHGQANRLDAAIDFITRAIHIDQTNPEYFANLGSLLAKQNRFDEALKSYEIALKVKPDSAAVWVGIGNLQRQQKRFQEALLAYDHALSLDPRQPDAADKAGSLLIEMQRHAEALEIFEKSDTLRPGRSETLFSKGVCFQALMRREEAVASYTLALAADGRNCQARLNLGAILLEMDRCEEAAVHFRKALQLTPHDVGAFNNLGVVLIRLKRYEEALTVFNRAIARAPDFVEAMNNRGDLLRLMGRPEEALADFDRVISLSPNSHIYHANRGKCLDNLLRSEEAMQSYQTAIALKPDHAAAHWSLAVNRLRVGDFKTGWLEAEWRWKTHSLGLNRGSWNRPLWLGTEPIAGKSLLLHNHEGLGDAIQLCRYIPLLAERGARVILEIDVALKELLSSVAGISHCALRGEALPDHDFQCPLMSLPLAFDTTLDTIPSTVPYVSINGHSRNWNAFLGPTGRLRVGIVWCGNPKHQNDHNRSMPLKTLAPLFDVGAQFVSLQMNGREDDLVLLRQRIDVLDAAPEIGSFADTAALIQQLDLVISVDTSVAHLAGALGKPVWVLLPYVPDYRWLLDRDDCPWYPTARLYRQTATRDYAGVVERVRADLLREVETKQSHVLPSAAP